MVVPITVGTSDPRPEPHTLQDMYDGLLGHFDSRDCIGNPQPAEGPQGSSTAEQNRYGFPAAGQNPYGFPNSVATPLGATF